MADNLSASEVDSLLSALDPDEIAAAPQAIGNANISVYDFKRPERVSKEQMRGLQGLHDNFGRDFAAGLSAMMRSMVEVNLVSTDQLTYGEFVNSLENPTCFNLLSVEGVDGDFIFEMQPKIIYPIVDRLLGGHKETVTHIPKRPMTEIELCLVERITKIVTKSLENAWANITELQMSVSATESNPQIVQLVPPNEVVVVVAFEVVMGEATGIANICVPFATIEPIASKLSSDTWTSYTRKPLTPRQRLNLETGLSSATVEVVAHIADTKLTAGEVAGLGVGDVITTEYDVHRGLKLCVEGQPMFVGQPGLLKGHKAVEIQTHIDRIETVIDHKLGEHE